MDTIDNKEQQHHAYYKLTTNIQISKRSTLTFSDLHDLRHILFERKKNFKTLKKINHKIDRVDKNFFKINISKYMHI